MSWRAAAIGLAGWLAAGCFSDGPIGMLPGGALRSTTATCPTMSGSGESGSWQRFRSEIESELEVRPSCPRSVRTWNVVHDGALYVPADFLTPIKRWPHQVLDDPDVRIRIGGETFACRATRVDHPELVEALRTEVASKYEIEPDSRAARIEVWWFRIDPR